MSNYYLRASPRILISRASDYSNPEVRPDAVGPYELTPDEYVKRAVQVDTTLTSLDLDEFASIDSLVVKNNSTSSAVNVFVTMLLGSKTYAGAEMTANTAAKTLTRSDAGGDFKVDGAIPSSYIRLSGGNNTGRYLIYSLTSTILTLAGNETLATDGADAGTPTAQIEQDLVIRLPADSVLMIGGSVRPASGFAAQAVTASSDIDLLVSGT